MSFFPTSTGSKLHLIKAAQCTLESLELKGLLKVQYRQNSIDIIGYSIFDASSSKMAFFHLDRAYLYVK
jgi:hypothetical protein